MQSDTTASDPATNAYFASTLRYIQFQKQKGGVMGEKFDAVKVWHWEFAVLNWKLECWLH